ncbi:MAG: hypothetical protein ACOCXQ_01790 [Patescibacteria group bacterium]
MQADTEGQKRLHETGVPIRMVPLPSMRYLLEITAVLVILFIGLLSMLYLHGSKLAEMEQREAERLARLERAGGARADGSVLGSGYQDENGLVRGASGQVLGEVLQAVDGTGEGAGSRSSGATPSGRFLVNVPSEFGSTVRVQGREILRDLLEGSGIQLVGDEGAPQIVNADPGSAQNIFKVIDINGETLTADSNESVLSFEAGEGLEVSVQNGRIVISTAAGSADSEDSGEDAGDTINNVTNVTEVTQVVDGGGFERNTADGNVALQTNTDTVSIGTEVAQGKLTVISTDTSQTGLAVQALAGQTAALADFKGADGESLITFDPEGNAVFKGNITQTGNTRIIGGGLTFNSTDPIVFDGVVDEPGNILENPGLEEDLDGWSASTPTLVNQISNPDFDNTDKLTGWVGTVDGDDFPEEFTNTGFESDLSGWDIDVPPPNYLIFNSEQHSY